MFAHLHVDSQEYLYNNKSVISKASFIKIMFYVLPTLVKSKINRFSKCNHQKIMFYCPALNQVDSAYVIMINEAYG